MLTIDLEKINKVSRSVAQVHVLKFSKELRLSLDKHTIGTCFFVKEGNDIFALTSLHTFQRLSNFRVLITLPDVDCYHRLRAKIFESFLINDEDKLIGEILSEEWVISGVIDQEMLKKRRSYIQSLVTKNQIHYLQDPTLNLNTYPAIDVAKIKNCPNSLKKLEK